MKSPRLNTSFRILKKASAGETGRYVWIRTVLVAATLAMVLSPAGCVRRKLTVHTEPQGAVIWLNDEEIGRSPATVDFLWYGDYDVVARLKGYEALRTHQRIVEPWYQAPGIDFIAEVLYPGWIVDSREMQFEMKPESLPTRDALLENARLTREMALADPNKSPAQDVVTETESFPDSETNSENDSHSDDASEMAPE